MLYIASVSTSCRHPREGGGLVHRRKAIFINALRAVQTPACAGVAVREGV